MKKNIANPFGIDEIRFSVCFSAPGFRIFLALVVGWVLTVGKHTVSQVILSMKLHESRHFATIYRFLGNGQWSVDMVSACLFSVLVETLVAEGAEIPVILDDTLNKHCGRHICGAGWQHDGSAPKQAKQTGYGVCFVIVGLAVRLPEVSDRVFCLPYAARLWWPPKAGVKPQALPYKKKPELGLELINLTHSWLGPGERMRVVTDLAYCCKAILRGRPKAVRVTGRIKKRSALFALAEPPARRGRGRPRTKGHRLPQTAAMFADPDLSWSHISVFCYGKRIRLMVHQFTALWYHSAGQEPVSVVLCYDPKGKYADTVFFDTDLTASANGVAEGYGARWSIEITNRETKQLLGADEPQCRREKSVIRAPIFAYFSYSFVVIWFAGHFASARNLVAQPAPWYRRKKDLTFSDMLAAARRSHFQLRISPEACDSNILPKKPEPRSARKLDHARIAKL